MNTDIKNRESFVFHRDWFDVISKRDDATRLEVYDAIMEKAFNNSEKALSDLASVVMDFVIPQINRDTQKWVEIREKRSKAGAKHNGNQYVTKLEQNGTNGTSVPTLEQNGTNGTVSVSVSVDNISKDNVILKEKEDKSSTKKHQRTTPISQPLDDVSDFIERMYNLYPSKCPLRNTTLGKCSKDKDRIRKLLKTYSMADIEKVFNKEIEEKYGKHYMQNFSTFLNNFPDPKSLFEEGISQECQETNNPYPQGYWQ